MKNKLIIILGSILAVLALGVGVGAYWWLMRPQTIVLDDGTQLTLLAVTYGKHHVLPKSKLGGRKVQNATMNTINDAVVVWVEQKHEQNNWPNYQMLAYDADNTACAGESARTYANFSGNRQGDEVMGFAYQAFPRRGSKIKLRIQAWNMRNGKQDYAESYFSIRNPAPSAAYAKWTPDKLPNSQQDGDLQVTLTRVELETNTFNQYGQNVLPNDPSRGGLLTAFHVEQGGVAVTNWQPVQVETSDATGNLARNRGRIIRRENDEEVMVYQWGLWPDEPAWKLRVEMSRKSGFNADEVWTAGNIPLEPGKMNDIFQGNNRKAKAAAETMLGEIKVQVFPAIKLPEDQVRNYARSMEGIFRIHADPAPDGMRLTVIEITDDQGKDIPFGDWGSGGRDYRFQLKKLGDAKTINVKLALHRSRYMEFTVAPPAKK